MNTTMYGIQQLSMLKRLAIFSFTLLAIGCSHPGNAGTVTVFAAASLREAMDEAARQFEAQGGDKVVVAYAASSALARQIEGGAPADIFISADTEWMDYLAARRLLREGTRNNLLANRLVMIAPVGSKIRFELTRQLDMASLLGRDRLAMADPDSVPAGKYGRAALEALGLWGALSGRVARTENVRACLLLVSRGEAPLGIVYRTDALADPRVRIVAEFAASRHAPIVYPIAQTRVGNSAGAARLLQFLGTPAARAIWDRHGFLPP
jgi:molybdate transport system substrate-binding protein